MHIHMLKALDPDAFSSMAIINSEMWNEGEEVN